MIQSNIVSMVKSYITFISSIRRKYILTFVLHPDDSWVLKFYIFFAKLGVIKKTIWTLLSNHCISLPSDMANIFLIHTLKL